MAKSSLANKEEKISIRGTNGRKDKEINQKQLSKMHLQRFQKYAA